MAWSIRPYVVFVWGEMFPDAIACRVTSQVVWSKNSSTLIHKRLSDRLRQPKVQYTLRRQAIGWHEQCGMTGHHKTIPYGHRAYGKRGYPFNAGQLGYDCRYSKTHGVPCTGG